MKRTKKAIAERDEARAKLREQIKPGDTVHVVLRHRARSGMYRVLDLYHIKDGELLRITWSAATATERHYDRKHDGLAANGCGMDMGFDAVYALSYALHPDGFGCIGKGCPSNDHSNGDRDYTPHPHKDGGYSLRHRWL